MSFDTCRTISIVPRISVAALIISTYLGQFASGQIVTSPFVTGGFQGWQSTYTPQPTQVGGLPSWGILLTPDPTGSNDQFLIETSDGRRADGVTTATVPDGKWLPYNMINTIDTTPANYTLNYQLATRDDDGFGLIFGYQDENNYFKVGFRGQAGSNLGFATGTSVQKVVGGVVTQLGAPTTSFVVPTTGTAFEAKVIVTGNNYDIQTNTAVGGAFTSVLSGSDPGLLPGKYGVHSWAQHELSTAVPNYGTMVKQVSVASASLNKTTNFTNALTGTVPCAGW